MVLSRMVIFLTTLCASLAVSSVAQSNNLCLLCQNGNVGLRRPYYVVDAFGTKCIDQAMNMARKFQPDTKQCSAQIKQFRDVCCGDKDPALIPQSPTSAPVHNYNGPVGSHPSCDICRDGDFPGNPSMVINMLYVGSGSCRQFYYGARAGNIPNHLCDTLQFFAYEPCGCGKFNKPQDNSATVTGMSVATSRPNPMPTKRPTPRPTININKPSPSLVTPPGLSPPVTVHTQGSNVNTPGLPPHILSVTVSHNKPTVTSQATPKVTTNGKLTSPSASPTSGQPNKKTKKEKARKQMQMRNLRGALK